MKKLFLSALLAGLFLIPTTNVSAQNERKETSHWSLGIKGGGTYFRVSPNTGDYLENASWGAGGVLEYTINPLWGFGLSVDYLNYDRGDNNDMLGNTLDAGLYGSINVLNLLSPNRKGWRRGGVYFNLGGGVGSYNAEVENVKIEEDNIALFSTVGVSIEVPLGNTFALFTDGQYRRYATRNDDLGGRPSHKNDALYAALGLRVKFNANKKDHVRNMRPFTDQDAMNAIKNELRQVKNQANKIASDVDNLDNRVNADRRKQEAINEEVQNDLENLRTALEDLRNQETANVVMRNIQFKFDSAELTAASFAALDQYAAELKSNSNWTKLTLAGHTDNIGSTVVNKRLSLARAESVKAYLVRQGIPASKIETVGFGYERPIASNNTRAGREQNRRVEFQLSR